jgi:hypothetical protein
MSTGDKITWGYRSLILLGLVWLRLLEKYIPIWGVLPVWGLFMLYMIRKPGEATPEQQQRQAESRPESGGDQ